MTDQLFIFIILIHYLADFGLQTHQQSKMKSEKFIYLLDHTFVYSAVWFIAALVFLPIDQAALFALITLVAHTITDFFTSRISKTYFAKKDIHNGFSVIGFDQMLHYLQLHYTFNLFL